MQVALIGYGKMGRKIEDVLLSRSHTITHKIGSQNTADLKNLKPTQVAIEFSRPDVCLENIHACLQQNIPLVVGTTGWQEHMKQVQEWVKKYDGTLVHGSNFSIGVQILFELNRHLARIMNSFNQYEVELTEEHHIHKLDKPSGTGITLASDAIDRLDRKNAWTIDEATDERLLKIVTKREGDTIGYHSMRYYSKIDELMITHNAFNRDGFAQGAVLAAEWIRDKKGFFDFKDCLNLPKA